MSKCQPLIDRARQLRRERADGRFFVSDVSLIEVLHEMLDARRRCRGEVNRYALQREIDRVETALALPVGLAA